MQTTEVTQGQWRSVMGSNPSDFANCGNNCPVENVSWDDIQSFITAMNQRGDGTYRLPTEAEWEYAARAGSTSAFANGGISVTDCSYDPNLDAMGWYCGNASSTTHSVGGKQPNAWGLYDMHGNVWEWCQDWYGGLSDGRGDRPDRPVFGLGPGAAGAGAGPTAPGTAAPPVAASSPAAGAATAGSGWWSFQVSKGRQVRGVEETPSRAGPPAEPARSRRCRLDGAGGSEQGGPGAGCDFF